MMLEKDGPETSVGSVSPQDESDETKTMAERQDQLKIVKASL